MEARARRVGRRRSPRCGARPRGALAQQLPELSGRYRALVDDAAKGPGAKKRLDAIVVAATQMLVATRTPAPGKVLPLPITLSAVAVFLILMSWLAYAVWSRP